jgi:glycosyltransferase involved in cell wall biosynthesis
MKKARVLIVPSIYYENFPVVIAEAYAVGLPVIASHLGSMSSLIVDSRTGLLFRRGDSDDLATKLTWLWTHPREWEEMRRAARQEYESKYTGARNHEILMAIYARAAATRATISSGRRPHHLVHS